MFAWLVGFDLLFWSLASSLGNSFDFLALADQKENYTGTGGGAGKPLTPVEEQVLQVMQNRD